MGSGGSLLEGWQKLVFKLQANDVCSGTDVITKAPNLFQAYGPGLFPSRLDGKFPINPALLPVFRALWEFPGSLAVEFLNFSF